MPTTRGGTRAISRLPLTVANASATRCTVTMTENGMTQVAHHESSADGASWTASMDVILRKVA